MYMVKIYDPTYWEIMTSIKGDLTILFENNVACIAQIIGGYIKEDRIKHISPKFFCTHEL